MKIPLVKFQNAQTIVSLTYVLFVTLALIVKCYITISSYVHMVLVSYDLYEKLTLGS